MADTKSKEARSHNMSRIRSKDTKPEILVRKYLFAKGLRFRIHDKQLPGKPDIILPKYRTAVFVNGCFWHGHRGCRYYSTPKTRTDWWEAKISKNVLNDNNAHQKLTAAGWRVIIIWGCELRGAALTKTLARVVGEIVGNIHQTV